MKHAKKLTFVLLTLGLAFLLAFSAFAATVSNVTEHSYNAYQIFKGTQATDNGALGDVVWGSGINGDTFLAALKADARFVVGDANIFAGCTTAADVATVLGKNPGVAEAFANVADAYTTNVCTSIAAGDTSVDLAAGYYLLVDTGDTSGTSDAKNPALLQVTDSIKITVKYNIPTVDKSVTDTDGKDGEAADYSIGSDVPFTLTGTLPSNYADYETYKYVFHDTLSAGLSYNGDAKVYVANKVGEETVKTEVVTGSFTISHTNGTLTVSCDNLKALSGVTIDANSKIVVSYTAKLTAAAEIGHPGNSNKVYLEYSNNPNQTGTGTTETGNTPPDEVLVFTYKLDVTKIDGQNTATALPGAEFVLLSSDKTKAAVVANGKITGWADVTTADGKTTYPAGSTLTSDEDGKFAVAGLDAGTYYLVETKAPAGYNLLKNPIKVTIAAKLDKSENNPALTALT
ncbi:MAG: isopeptide-forming domain-containing fimbrial protein, partial [Clostridiaceae bacterium]|nr:isopeptide-forming domain-containing fimbrial protein [Clostridiaceae bacterium]